MKRLTLLLTSVHRGELVGIFHTGGLLLLLDTSLVKEFGFFSRYISSHFCLLQSKKDNYLVISMFVMSEKSFALMGEQVEQPANSEQDIKSAAINRNLLPENGTDVEMTEVQDASEPSVNGPTINETQVPVIDPETTANGPNPSVPPAVSRPLIDLSPTPTPTPTPSAVTSAGPSAPVLEASAGPSVPVLEEPEYNEDVLLKELEKMGFRQIDLNKEVLRLNKYDLEQSVDDLCGLSEWDPLLEELKEMVNNDARPLK